MKTFTFIFGFILLASAVFAQDDHWQTYYEKSNGKATPNYEQTILFCQKLAYHSPFVKYTTFGESPQGRELPLLIIDKNGNFTPQEVKKSGNAILFVEAGIHSGEIEGKDAMFSFIT